MPRKIWGTNIGRCYRPATINRKVHKRLTTNMFPGAAPTSLRIRLSLGQSNSKSHQIPKGGATKLGQQVTAPYVTAYSESYSFFVCSVSSDANTWHHTRRHRWGRPDHHKCEAQACQDMRRGFATVEWRSGLPFGVMMIWSQTVRSLRHASVKLSRPCLCLGTTHM